MLGETIMSLCILVASCYLYYEATQLRMFRAYREVGPDFWPKIVLTILIGLSAVLTLYNVLAWRKKSRGNEQVAEEKEENWKRVLIVSLLAVGYVYFLKTLGFIVASPLFIIGMMLVIMPERKKVIPFGVIGIMVMIYIIFNKLLFVPLPKGFGIFHDISIFLGL
jgi:putative tricarboxylic transport membrane protein